MRRLRNNEAARWKAMLCSSTGTLTTPRTRTTSNYKCFVKSYRSGRLYELGWRLEGAYQHMMFWPADAICYKHLMLPWYTTEAAS